MQDKINDKAKKLLKEIEEVLDRPINLHGLTHDEVQEFTDLVVKANTEQLIAMRRTIHEEIEERVTKEIEEQPSRHKKKK